MTDLTSLSITDVTKILDIDRKSVKHLFDTNQLNYYMLGKQKRTSLTNIKEFLNTPYKAPVKAKRHTKIVRLMPDNEFQKKWK